MSQETCPKSKPRNNVYAFIQTNVINMFKDLKEFV